MYKFARITYEKVKQHLEQIKVNKSTAPGDIPAKIIKELAPHLCIPVADIINTAIKRGQWPKLYKIETITPIIFTLLKYQRSRQEKIKAL